MNVLPIQAKVEIEEMPILGTGKLDLKGIKLKAEEGVADWKTKDLEKLRSDHSKFLAEWMIMEMKLAAMRPMLKDVRQEFKEIEEEWRKELNVNPDF